MLKNLAQLKEYPRFTEGIFYNGTYSIKFNDSLSFYYEYSEIFDKKIYDFQSDNGSPYIIDAGGFVGLTALYFKGLYPGATLTVFEPDPAVFRLLKENMETNGLENVELVEAGLGREAGKMTFYPDNADGGTMIPTEGKAPIEVDVRRLSDYIDGPVDLLKMNIEGLEGDVFEEIEPKLSFVKEIILEYHAFADLPQTLGDILVRLDRKGFRYLVTSVPCAPVPIPFRMNENYKCFNLVYGKRIKASV